MLLQKRYFNDAGTLLIRPYMIKDLAAIYNVSRHTIRRWINKSVPDAGEKINKFFTVEQVQAIINALGTPKQSL